MKHPVTLSSTETMCERGELKSVTNEGFCLEENEITTEQRVDCASTEPDDGITVSKFINQLSEEKGSKMEPASADQELESFKKSTKDDCSRSGSIASVHVSNLYKSSEVHFYIHISFFSMLGCLCRIGTEKLFGSEVFNVEDQSAIINLSFMSNIVGSFALGALHSSPLGKTKLGTVYKGLTTGFCGSYTTWSKWNQQINLLLVGETSTNAQSQVVALMAMLIGIYSFITSYCVGIDFGKDVGFKIGQHIHQCGPKIIDLMVSILLFIAVVGFSLGVAFDPSVVGKKIYLAVLLVPFGSCTRAWLSRHHIKRLKLPLGTFIVNLIGSVCLAIVHVINVRAADPACSSTTTVCWPTIVTYAIGSGFCASLTTISTVMSEIYNTRSEHPRFAYFYIVLSIVVCQSFSGIINGVSFAIK